MTITLTEDEFEVLLIACGYATGAAMKEGNVALAKSFVKITNAVNRDNPEWKPYDIPSVTPQ